METKVVNIQPILFHQKYNSTQIMQLMKKNGMNVNHFRFHITISYDKLAMLYKSWAPDAFTFRTRDLVTFYKNR